MRRLRLVAEGLAALLCLLAMAGTYLTKPVPRPRLPYAEVSVRLSGDGRRACFTAQRGALARGRLFDRRDSYPGAADFTDVYLTDLDRGETRCLSEGGNGPSYQPAFSPNGQWLAFASEASNLTSGDDDACVDIFRWSAAGLTRIPGPAGLEGRCPAYDPAVTDQGLVAFSRCGPDAQRRLLAWDGQGPARVLEPSPIYGAPSFAPGGGRLAVSRFAPRVEASGTRLTAEIELLDLSRQPEGWVAARPQAIPCGRPAFSPALADHACAFASVGENGYYQVFVQDSEGVAPVTDGQEDAFEPSLSQDGHWLAYTGYNETHESQVYLYDRQLKTTRWLAAGWSPSLAGDGSRVAYVTQSQILVLDRASDSLRRLTP